MKIDNVDSYPVIKKKIFNIQLFRYILLGFLALAYIACFIVNVSVGGAPWHLYVLVGEWLFWTLIVSRSLVEAGLIRRLINVTIVTCLLLALLDGFSGNTGWAINMVIPIIFFSVLIVSSLYFSVRFKRQKQNFFLLFAFTIGSLIAITLGLVKLIDLKWPLIVLGSYALAFIILAVILFRKSLLHELRKRFHIKG